MKKFYNLLFNNKLFLLVTLFSMALSLPGFCQIGFDNPNPDTTALIDMKATDKGLLIPRLTTTQRTLMNSGGKRVAHALLVFDNDQNMFFVYDTIANPDRWVAVNPFQAVSNTGNITTPITGNVGIGTTNPTAKLEVNGNIKANGVSSNGDISTTGNVNATGNISAATMTSGNITSTGNVTSSGNVTATSFTGNGTIPLGGIIMWSGTTVPAGWALCNGQTVNGITTPNLSGRFVVGTGSLTENGNTYTYSIGTTGGEAKHTLSVAEIPSHNHGTDIAEFFSDESESGTSGGGFQAGGGWTTYPTTYTGGGQAHENRPPFYSLAYIMRVK